MFEAIHGSAPRMMEEGIGEYANPASINRAAVMMLRHIGFTDQAAVLEKALDAAQEALDDAGRRYRQHSIRLHIIRTGQNIGR